MTPPNCPVCDSGFVILEWFQHHGRLGCPACGADTILDLDGGVTEEAA